MRNKDIVQKRDELIYQYYCIRWGDGIRDEKIVFELMDQFFLAKKNH